MKNKPELKSLADGFAKAIQDTLDEHPDNSTTTLEGVEMIIAPLAYRIYSQTREGAEVIRILGLSGDEIPSTMVPPFTPPPSTVAGGLLSGMMSDESLRVSAVTALTMRRPFIGDPITPIDWAKRIMELVANPDDETKERAKQATAIAVAAKVMMQGLNADHSRN